MRIAACLGLLLSFLAGAAGAAEFRILEGHGGPVMAVAVNSDDGWALTASFDNSVGLWNPAGGDPLWLEGHEAAVKVVAFAGSGKAASGGDDFAIQVWDLAKGEALFRLKGHEGPIVDLSVHDDMLASAGWDGRIGLWDLAAGTHLGWLEGHKGSVNAVRFADNGAALFSASADGTVLKWDVAAGSVTGIVARHGFGVNKLVIDEAAGWIAYGAVDGGTRAVDLESGETVADLTLERRPVLAMALHDGRLAVGDGEGWIMVVQTEDWRVIRDFRAALKGPIWALSWTPDGALLAGGIEDSAYLWPILGSNEDPEPMATQKRAFHVDPEAVSNGERQFLRKCAVCHTLTGDGGRRAGPTLAGVFGRKAGSVRGYPYSQAVSRSNVIWSGETIDRLFDLGPNSFLPGTKMPMQRITAATDRRDLIEYLRVKTKD